VPFGSLTSNALDRYADFREITLALAACAATEEGNLASWLALLLVAGALAFVAVVAAAVTLVIVLGRRRSSNR
jgi:hypothetical protein